MSLLSLLLLFFLIQLASCFGNPLALRSLLLQHFLPLLLLGYTLLLKLLLSLSLHALHLLTLLKLTSLLLPLTLLLSLLLGNDFLFCALSRLLLTFNHILLSSDSLLLSLFRIGLLLRLCSLLIGNQPLLENLLLQ